MHKCRRKEKPEQQAHDTSQHMRAPQRQVACRECRRTFHRQGDLKRRKCLTKRSKSVEEQRGVQSATGFISAGGLSAHRQRIHGPKH